MTAIGITADGELLFESGLVSTTETTPSFGQAIVISEVRTTDIQHKCSYCGRLSEINQTKTLCEGCGAPLERENS